MPSPRRLRLLMLATLVTVVLILMYVSGFNDGAANDKRTIKDFYHKTMDGMNKGNKPPGQAVLDKGAAARPVPPGKDPGHGQEFAADTKERLKAAEQKAKAKANGKALRPDPPSQIVGVGNSAEGQAKKPKPAADDAPSPRPKAVAETDEEHEAEMDLKSILKKAPGTLGSAPVLSLLFPSRGAVRPLALSSNTASREEDVEMQIKDRGLADRRVSVVISHHLLQDTLPLFAASQGHPPAEIFHQARALRRRARPAQARQPLAGPASREDAPAHRAQHHGQRRQHRGQRQDCRARRRRQAGR